MTKRPFPRPVHLLIADAIADVATAFQKRAAQHQARALRSHTMHVIEDLPLEIRKDIGWR